MRAVFRNRQWFVDSIVFVATQLEYEVTWHHDHAIRFIDSNRREPDIVIGSMDEALAFLKRKL
jgi:hypothetical protein